MSVHPKKIMRTSAGLRDALFDAVYFAGSLEALLIRDLERTATQKIILKGR